MLIDNHGRTIDYLRLAITDRCDLRCQYCMPAGGLDWVPRNELLSYEEMMRILRIASSLGVSKIRLTGGEPFMRKDFMSFVRTLSKANLFEKIALTTNGTHTYKYISELKELGIQSVNLSLDTFDRDRFFSITRRNVFDDVMKTFQSLLEHDMSVRINAVIMEGINDQDIISLAQLTKDYPIGVRFIEEMPFNGRGDRHAIKWTWKAIEKELKDTFPELTAREYEPTSTSNNYTIPGHQGHVGIIAAYSRSFCGTCNRIRITPKGSIKTCLYDGGVFSIRDLIRSGASDLQIAEAIEGAVSKRFKNGFEAEEYPVNESMAEIGG